MAYSQVFVSPNSWQLQRSKGQTPFAPIPSLGFTRKVYCRVRHSGFTVRCGESDPPKEPRKKILPLDSGWSFPDEKTPKQNKLTGYLKTGAGLFLAIGLALGLHNLYSRRGVRGQLFAHLRTEQGTIFHADGCNLAVSSHGGDHANGSLSDVQNQRQNEELDVDVGMSGSELQETAEHKELDSGSAAGVPVANHFVEPSMVASDFVANSTCTCQPENVDAFATVPDFDTNSRGLTEPVDPEVSLPASYSEISIISSVSKCSSLDPNNGAQNGEANFNKRGTVLETNSNIGNVISGIASPSTSATSEGESPVQNSASAVFLNDPETEVEISQSLNGNRISVAFETVPSFVSTKVGVSETALEMGESGVHGTASPSFVPKTNVAFASALGGSIGINSSGPDGEVKRASMFESYIPAFGSQQLPFTSAGIPGPSLPYAALHETSGKVVVPAVVDHLQGQTLAALQALKVVEAGIEPTGICTRRQYARWLIAANDVFCRNPASKLFPAMYIENLTELAFSDVTPDDPDFPFIQGLAEAGLISSKLSVHDRSGSLEDVEKDGYMFSPDSPLSRQDLVSWKIALERRQLPKVDSKMVMEKSGFIDIDKINHDAWPAIFTDLSSGEQSIVAGAFGHTRLFQPSKPVTNAQAAVALASGEAAELVTEELARIEADLLAEAAVSAHAALEAQLQKDLNSAFEKELELEKDKINVAERLAKEARLKLELLRAEREEEKHSLMRDRAAIHSESELLSKLRHEIAEQAQALVTKKLEISFERDQLDRLQKEAEGEKRYLVQIQSEVEIEKKALCIARTWAEDEAKKVWAHAKVLEEARKHWESQGVQVHVDKELAMDDIPGLTWQYGAEIQKNTGKLPFHEILAKSNEVRGKLTVVADDVREKFLAMIGKITEALGLITSSMEQKVEEAGKNAQELQQGAVGVASKAVQEMQNSALASLTGLTSSIGEGAKRLTNECRAGAGKISEKFKT